MGSISSYDIVICGAGIAGVATAYNLAVRRDIKNILLVDMNPPLSLTSDHSSECYRNWWPGPGDEMVALMNKSIDILEQMAEISGNSFHLNRRGYLYCTEDSSRIPNLITEARKISNLGAGDLRIHDNSTKPNNYSPSPASGYKNIPSGADLFLDSDLINKYFPYLADEITAVLHIRRAGWLSAQQLGRYMLEEARKQGVSFLSRKVNKVIIENGKINSVILSDGKKIHTSIFINAAGPFVSEVSKQLGLELPVFSERHLKITMTDSIGVVDRNAPLLIYNDPQFIPWAEEEITFFQEDTSFNWLLNKFPPGAHTRPEGAGNSKSIIMLWEYNTTPIKPIFPVPIKDPIYHEITLHGLSRMLPKMQNYFSKIPKPSIDGGYYTKTRENRPLISPLPVKGAYIIGALSGFGIMSACGAADLLSAYIANERLPNYAPAFSIERYQNKKYLESIENIQNTGQL